MVGLIIPVPKEVAESGYIKIVGDARNSRANPHYNYYNFELLAVEYLVDTNKYKGKYFRVTEKEVQEWIKNQPSENVQGPLLEQKTP